MQVVGDYDEDGITDLQARCARLRRELAAARDEAFNVVLQQHDCPNAEGKFHPDFPPPRDSCEVCKAVDAARAVLAKDGKEGRV